MANLNALVCFLREIKVAVGGDIGGDLHEPGSERYFPLIDRLPSENEGAAGTCFAFLAAGAITRIRTIHGEPPG
jgi:hypothetical protein